MKEFSHKHNGIKYSLVGEDRAWSVFVDGKMIVELASTKALAKRFAKSAIDKIAK